MGVEPGDGDARAFDPEIADQCRCGDRHAVADQLDRQEPRHFGQRDVDRDRHHPQARPGEHHHRVARRDTAALGDVFGLAGVGEADRGKLRLGDGRRDQRRRRAAADQPGGDLERLKCQLRARHVRRAGGVIEARDVEHRQHVAEAGGCRIGRVDRQQRDCQPAGPRRSGKDRDTADHEERRKARLAPLKPGRAGKLRPDPGGVAD